MFFFFQFRKVNKTPVTKAQLDVKDLVEFNEYEFRVIAENEAGLSKPSDSTGKVVPKNPYAKPTKVRDVTIKETTRDSVTLTWKEPETDGNSAITNYVIEVKAVGEFTWIVANSDKVSFDFVYIFYFLMKA